MRNSLADSFSRSDHSAPGSNPYAQAQQQSYPPQQQYDQYAQVPQAYSPVGGNYPMTETGGGVGGGDFWSQLTDTNNLLAQLEQEIQAVRNGHQQSLNSSDPNAIANVDRLSDQAKSTREQCKLAIKSLAKQSKGNKQFKQQVDTANNRFRGLLQEHQQVEKEYRKKTRDRAERQYKIVKPDATPEEIKDVIDSDNPQVFAQALLNTNRYGAARGAYREVQERHAEIQKIEKTMTELAQMFNEMAMLVEQQNEAIADVENQTQQVNTDIQRG